MATYTVYVPLGGGESRRADRTIFIREGFSVAAFVFGPLYLLYRRLWLAAFGWIVAAALVVALVRALDLSPLQLTALVFLLALLTGFEATVLRQFGMKRRGYHAAALATRPTLEQAERAFFSGESLPDLPIRAPIGEIWPERIAPSRPPEVIGSFPQAGGV